MRDDITTLNLIKYRIEKAAKDQHGSFTSLCKQALGIIENNLSRISQHLSEPDILAPHLKRNYDLKTIESLLNDSDALDELKDMRQDFLKALSDCIEIMRDITYDNNR